MTPLRLLAIALVLVLTTVAWVVLGGTLQIRTQSAAARLDPIVVGNWGGALTQNHPDAFYLVPSAATPRRTIAPSTSAISVDLRYAPKKKGLLRYRTYTLDFAADYTFRNPTPIAQTLYLRFQLPAETGFDRFSFVVDGTESSREPDGSGLLVEAVSLAPGATSALTVSYTGNGLGTYAYDFGGLRRVRAFSLALTTDFAEIDFPAGAASPNARQATGGGWDLRWNYHDVIAPKPLGIAMPDILNPGPVASRISLFAPVSLLFYFAVLIVLCLLRGVNLHPINFAFLAAGCFAFQLLFTYLVDLAPPFVAFAAGASVSVGLVAGYLWRVAGLAFSRLATLAQLAFMVLFSYSFFFDGLTGITITVGAVVTLALLMATTAKVDWAQMLRPKILKSPIAN